MSANSSFAIDQSEHEPTLFTKSPDNTPDGAGPSRPLGLPRHLSSYIGDFGATVSKAMAWISARLQLHSCNAIGSWPRVYGKVRLTNYGSIILGSKVRFYGQHYPPSIVVFPGGRLVVGDRAVFNFGLDLAATGSVEIGHDVMIGTHVMIIDNDFHDPVNHDRMPEPRPVVIGDGAWIGNRAIVLPGVTIGERAVVGAGSVVMTDIPPRTLAMGNPALFIKRLWESLS
jgi:acetyltransferase-like isoleucine patch superfamily enzyme